MKDNSSNFFVSTDKGKIDLGLVHEFLTNSYWGKGRSKEQVERSIENSLSFGVYRGNEQVGFARIISDYATFAYLADVFVLPSFQGKGLGKMLMSHIMDHDLLQNLRRWMLATRDAHELYAKFGFEPLESPEIMMEIKSS